MKIIQHATKEPFFSLFLKQKKTVKFRVNLFKKIVKGGKNQKNKIIYDLYWVLVGSFFGPYQYTKFHLINSVR